MIRIIRVICEICGLKASDANATKWIASPPFAWLRTTCYPATALVPGLIAAQILATLQVYLSNAGLYHALTVINDAGYLAIPNQQVANRLHGFGPAFFGGLFFTLSVGGGLSILALAAAWIWNRLFYRKKLLLPLLWLPWIGSLAEVNSRGFCPMVSSYFLVIPVVVFWVSLRWMPPQTRKPVWLTGLGQLIPIILLVLLWLPQMGNRLFLDIRDNLLLSNTLGTKINDFYYRYTLYPAEVFKSLDQKMLKTCSLEHIRNGPARRLLERKLLDHDYLRVRGDLEVDLEIREVGNTLVFENRGRPVLRTSQNDFLSSLDNTLREFSLKSDRHAFFRGFVFFSILIGFPVTLYLFLYALFRSVLHIFLGLRISSIGASILCFLAGISFLIPLHPNKGGKITPADLTHDLKSGSWQERVAALKIICETGGEVADFDGYQRMVTSPHIPERYWSAKALGVSRKPETYRDILSCLNDGHPNVVSMAFYALGQRGDARAVQRIIREINKSGDWYNQWYAYKAMRALGWKQTRLK